MTTATRIGNTITLTFDAYAVEPLAHACRIAVAGRYRTTREDDHLLDIASALDGALTRQPTKLGELVERWSMQATGADPAVAGVLRRVVDELRALAAEQGLDVSGSRDGMRSLRDKAGAP